MHKGIALVFCALIPVGEASLTKEEVQGLVGHIKETAIAAVPKERRFLLNSVLRSLSRTERIDTFANETLANVTTLLREVLINLAEFKNNTDTEIATHMARCTACVTYDAQDAAYNATIDELIANHSAERAAQAAQLLLEDGNCTLLENYLTSLIVDGPQSFCDFPASTAGSSIWDAIFNDGSTYFTNTRTTYETYRDGCTTEATATSTAQSEADGTQSTLETTYCTWNSHRNLQCSNRPTCHSDAEALYNTFTASAIPASNLNTELARMIDYVICLTENLRLLESTDKSACPMLPYSNVPLQSTYNNTFPAWCPMVTCEALATYPGQTDFRSTVYGNLLTGTTPPAATTACA